MLAALPIPFLARRPIPFRVTTTVYAIALIPYAVVHAWGGEYGYPLPPDRWRLWAATVRMGCAAPVPARARLVASAR